MSNRYEVYPRQHKLPIRDRNDIRRAALIDARPAGPDAVATWAVAVNNPAAKQIKA